MVGEILTRGTARIAEEQRGAHDYLMKSKVEELSEAYKEAQNTIHQAYLREETALRSTAFFASGDTKFAAYLDNVCKNVGSQERISMATLTEFYKNIAALHGVEPVFLELAAEEKRLDQLVPKRTKEMAGFFNFFAFHMRLRGIKDIPEYHLNDLEDFEIRNFINNKRSILEIRNAVSAEFRPIPLKDVENYIKVLEIGGMVTIEKKSK
jgi:hypothetical protein